MKIKMMSTNQEYIIEKVGVFTPKPRDINELSSGEIGFIITGIKNLSETKSWRYNLRRRKSIRKIFARF